MEQWKSAHIFKTLTKAPKNILVLYLQPLASIPPRTDRRKYLCVNPNRVRVLQVTFRDVTRIYVLQNLRVSRSMQRTLYNCLVYLSWQFQVSTHRVREFNFWTEKLIRPMPMDTVKLGLKSLMVTWGSRVCGWRAVSALLHRWLHRLIVHEGRNDFSARKTLLRIAGFGYFGISFCNLWWRLG